MIERFRDHAANERTYLAWVRTVLAIAGFGVLIDKLVPSAGGRSWFAPSLIALSFLLLAAATLRFHLVRRMIAENADDSPQYVWSERLLVGVVALLVLVVLVFLAGILRTPPPAA